MPADLPASFGYHKHVKLMKSQLCVCALISPQTAVSAVFGARFLSAWTVHRDSENSEAIPTPVSVHFS